MNSSDRIERTVVLRAPRSRVWHALTDARQFGEWFGVAMESGFAAGQRASGRITHPGYEHLAFEVNVERMDAQHTFSFRWHPYAIDPAVDYSTEPATLVEFRLQDVPEGTRLTVVESGFDRIPAARRAEAFRMNDSGWAAQMDNITRHVAS